MENIENKNISKLWKDFKKNGELFFMERINDSTGCSGTGVCLEGCVLQDGKCIVYWYKGRVGKSSLGIFDSFDDFKKIHITSHLENKAKIIWSKTVDNSI